MPLFWRIMSRGIEIMFCWGGGAQFFYKIKFVVYRTYRVGMAQCSYVYDLGCMVEVLEM